MNVDAGESVRLTVALCTYLLSGMAHNLFIQLFFYLVTQLTVCQELFFCGGGACMTVR